MNLEERITPDNGYVPLGSELVFHGQYAKSANAAGGFDFSFSGTTEIGWAPPTGLPASAETFTAAYTYAGSLIFNDDEKQPAGAPPTPAAPDELAFLLNNGTLKTVAIVDDGGAVLLPAQSVVAGEVRYVEVAPFVAGGLSIAAPVTVNFGKYVHVTVDNFGLGKKPTAVGAAVTYDAQLALRGSIVLGTVGEGAVNVAFAVNGSSYLGIDSTGFTLTGFTASVSGTFEVDGIKITVADAGLGYAAAAGEAPPTLFFFGSAEASFEDALDLSLGFGTGDNPGLVIDLGKDPGLAKLQFQAGGDSKLDGITIDFTALNFLYLPETASSPETYAVGGALDVQLTNQLRVAVALGEGTQPGLIVKDGEWELEGFSISIANLTLPGGWGFTKLFFGFNANSEGGTDIRGSVEVRVPGGFAVGGGLGFVDGQLSSVEIAYDVKEGEGFLRLPGTGLSISSIHARLQNLNQLSDLVLSGSVSVSFGPTTTLPGLNGTYTIARANLSGSFSSSLITLSGGIYFLAKETQPAPGADVNNPNNANYDPADSGYDADDDDEGDDDLVPASSPEAAAAQLPTFTGTLGSGNASLTVDLAQSTATVRADASFVGGLIRANFVFACDDSFDLFSTGSAGAYFPTKIPLVGGDEIAGAGFVFKWDNASKSGTIAAATNVLNTDVGFKYDIQNFAGDSNDFSIIYSGPFDGAFTGTQTYTLTVNPATLLSGATSAAFALDYADPSQLQSVTLVTPTGTTYRSTSNDFGNNGTTLDPNPPAGQFRFALDGSASNRFAPLTSGNYTLTLVTKSALSNPPRLTVNASVARPQVSFDPSFGANGTPQAVNGLLTVPVRGQAGYGVQPNTRVTLYADTDGTGADGVAVGSGLLPAGDAGNPGALASLTVTANLRGLLPIRYRLYAVIDDGINPPSAPVYLAAAVQANQAFFGQVLSAQTGKGVEGLFVWIDQNGDGVFTPPTLDANNAVVAAGDPGAFTSGGDGAYSFPRGGQELTLTQGQSYTLYLELPEGFSYTSSLPFAGAIDPAQPNRPARVQVPFTFTSGISNSFSLTQAPTISGLVTTKTFDANGNAISVGLQGVMAYVDYNNNGVLDAGSEPSGITDGQGRYRLLPLAAGDNVSYVVRLKLNANQSQDNNQANTVSVPLGTGVGTSSPIVDSDTFPVTRLAVIKGNVRGYLTSNGTLNSATTDLGNVTVKLLDASGNLTQSVLTDGIGNYQFAPVRPNVTYSVVVVPPAGFRQFGPQGTSPAFEVLNFLPNDITSAAHGDLNGDGTTDFIVTTNNSKNLGRYLGNPNGATSDIFYFNSGTEQDTIYKVVVGNVLGNGRLDIVAVDRSNYIYIYKNNGDGSFTFYGRLNFKFIGSEASPIDIAVGDFDGDGRDDVALSFGSTSPVNKSQIVIVTSSNIRGRSYDKNKTADFKNESDVYFQFQPASGGGLAVGYLNGLNDQYADLLVNGQDGSGVSIVIYGVAAGSRPSAFKTGVGTQYSPGQVAVGFLDNDSYLDNVFGYPGQGKSNAAVFLANVDANGNGTTTAVSGGPGGVYSLPMALVDLNLDGLADLVYSPSAFDQLGNSISGSPSVVSPVNVLINQLKYGFNPGSNPFLASALTTVNLDGYNAGGSGNAAQVVEVRTGYFRGPTRFGDASSFSADAFPDLFVTLRNGKGFLVLVNRTIATPNAFTVTPSATRDTAGVDFLYGETRGGKLQPSSFLAKPSNVLGGVVFDDANKSGQYEQADKARDGVTLYLDLNGDGKLDAAEPTATTNALGLYSFGGLADGTYTVREVADADRRWTAGASGYTFTLAGGTGGGDADLGSVVSRNLAFTASSDAVGGDWVVTRKGRFLEVLDRATNTQVAFVPLDDVNSLRFSGAAKAIDAVTLNFQTGGLIALPGGVRFSSGGDGGDRLTLAGGSIANAVELGPNSGTFDGLKVSWDRLGRVDLGTGEAQDAVSVRPAAGTRLTRVTRGGVTTVGGLPYALALTGAANLTPPPVAAGAQFATTAGDRVSLHDAAGMVLKTFAAFEDSFGGQVSVAVGDVTGDGVNDLLVGAGPGGGPRVRVFDGATGAVVRDFFAFEDSFRGGVNVALGDIDGDGRLDLVVAAGAGGGPRVRVFDNGGALVLRDFFAFEPSFAGGTTVAVGDFDGDGRVDLLVGAGGGGGPRVRVFDGATLTTRQDFFAFDASFRGGVSVAAADTDGDGTDEMVVGAGPGGGPQVGVYSGRGGEPVRGFFPFDASARGGVSVGSIDLDGDGRAELLTGSGVGSLPRVKAFDGVTLAEVVAVAAEEFAGSSSVAGAAAPLAKPQLADDASDLHFLGGVPVS